MPENNQAIKPNKGIGKLDKQVLGDFLESDCERQLYLSLGKQDPSWGLEDYEIRPLEKVCVGVSRRSNWNSMNKELKKQEMKMQSSGGN